MPFPAVFNLSTLDGSNGFQVNGEGVNLRTGLTVAAAGDINGDGLQDFLIFSPKAGVNGAYSAATYVVFGAAGGVPAEWNLSALDGINGFQIDGEASSSNVYGLARQSVAAAGDINGDGVDDLIIGGPAASINGSGSGAAWVLFGKNTAVSGAFTANVELSALDGATGFQVNGVAAGNQAGAAVSSAGDVNGDGIDDFMVSAYRTGTNGDFFGTTYVVFGKDTATDGNFAANLDLSSLDGTNGFRLTGQTGDYSGASTAAIGDVNGDGVDDILIGAFRADVNGHYAGAAYVVFGKNTAVAGAFAASVDLGALNGADGFRMNGLTARDSLGLSVASAGDLNGDGFDDFVVGAYGADANGDYSGASYVIFGKNTALSGNFAADFDLTTLDGTKGFVLNGQSYDYAGRALASAGDVNGDGVDDLLVAAYRANGTGAVYVVYGHTGAFNATLNLSNLDGTHGFRIDGEFGGDNFGFDVTAADINGDGLSDIIVSAPYSDAGGNFNGGAAYVIYGQSSGFTGNAGDQTYTGGAGADTLNGLGGKDTLHGAGGDDIIDGGADNDVLYGDDGEDHLLGGLGNDILNGGDGADTLEGGDGADKLFGNAGIDNLTGGDGNDYIYGGDSNDVITGGDGNDMLDGGTGADAMTGGAGNDVYIVDDQSDTTIEVATGGYDIVRTDLTWTLAANVEALELQGSTNAGGTGNADANRLIGNSGDNRLDGGAGVDTINGGDGDDFIIGGEGNDLLRGGTGADTFIVAHAFGSVLETDQIYDFSAAEGDIMDFHDAYAGTLSLVSSFGKHAGEMTLTFASGITTVKLDINGDGKADYQVKINGDVTGESGDWLL